MKKYKNVSCIKMTPSYINRILITYSDIHNREIRYSSLNSFLQLGQLSKNHIWSRGEALYSFKKFHVQIALKTSNWCLLPKAGLYSIPFPIFLTVKVCYPQVFLSTLYKSRVSWNIESLFLNIRMCN